MSDRYRQLRQEQRQTEMLLDAGRSKGDRRASFLIGVLTASLAVGVATWQLQPRFAAGWMKLNRTPEQIAADEASVFYAGCNEARAAGKAPIYRGQPGYRTGMGGDLDGIACEPYP